MKDESRSLLIQGASKMGLALDERDLSLFAIFLSELKKGNERISLTAIEDEREIITKHFLDSLSISLVHDFEAKERAIDIGSGAGFPGLPLKIIFDHLDMTLLESTKKKSDFSKELIEKMGLSSVEAVCCRAEDYGINSEGRGGFDLALVRAVAPLATLVEYALPLLRVGGSLLAMKAGLDQGEVEQGRRAASELGGRAEEIRDVSVPFIEAKRTIAIIKKVAPTPKGFPRRAGMAKKRPLGRG